MRNAVQSDWQNEPLPMSRATVRLDHRFTKEEMAKIRRGLVPQEMEDKWFITKSGTKRLRQTTVSWSSLLNGQMELVSVRTFVC